jgi:hypothetical protein
MVVSRITVDIDGHHDSPRLRVLRAYHGLLQHDAVCGVSVAVSSSHEGFHLVAECDEHVSVIERLRVRRNLGDDPKRVRMDEQRAKRGLPIGTMWTSKGGRDGERREFGDAEAALEYVDATSRSAAERAHGIQQHGHKAVRDAEVPHTRGVRVE